MAAPALFVPESGIFSPNGGFININEPTAFGPAYDAMDENAFLDMDAITDSDGDNIPDRDDNCRLTGNSLQRDSDEDGYGNACDCDLDNDGSVDISDFTQFRGYWGTGAAIADFNSDDSVDISDFMIFQSRWGTTVPFE